MGKAAQIIVGVVGVLVLVSLFGSDAGLTVDSVIDGAVHAITVVADTTVSVIPKLIEAVQTLFS